MICSTAESLIRTCGYLILGGVLCLALTACNSIDPALRPEALLPGSSWRLVAMEGRPVEGRSLPSIQFDKTSIAGETGCNRYAAPMLLSGSSIKIGSIRTSKRACDELIQNREARYIDCLSQAEHLEVSPDFLAIFCDEAKFPLRFARVE